MSTRLLLCHGKNLLQMVKSLNSDFTVVKYLNLVELVEAGNSIKVSKNVKKFKENFTDFPILLMIMNFLTNFY